MIVRERFLGHCFVPFEHVWDEIALCRMGFALYTALVLAKRFEVETPRCWYVYLIISMPYMSELMIL
jgi:hypothetical protein